MTFYSYVVKLQVKVCPPNAMDSGICTENIILTSNFTWLLGDIPSHHLHILGVNNENISRWMCLDLAR